MKKKILFLVFSFALQTLLYGQTSSTGKVINLTGKSVRFYQFYYGQDSLKDNGYERFFATYENKPDTGGFPIYNSIRIDVIAIDDSTKDTILVKSFNHEQIKSGQLVINITKNKSIEKLPPDIVTLPYIQIKTKNDSWRFKVSDTIDVKTQKEKTQGVIKSFDKESITLVDFQKNEIKILRKELTGIKKCHSFGFHIGAAGADVPLGCNYTKIEYPTFKKVHQVFVESPNGSSRFMWKE